MKNDINRLSSKRVANLLRNGTPGRHPDGRGLYLVIESKTNAHWERRYQVPGAQPRPSKNGKMVRPERYVGVGSAFVFGLAEARERNKEMSKLLADKIDPLAQRRAERAKQAADTAKALTFGQAAKKYFDSHAPSWSRVHTVQWQSTVLGLTAMGQPVKEDYCRILRSFPVQLVDTPAVLAVIEPLWHIRPETASRLRARIEAVLDWAVAGGYRTASDVASRKVIGKLLPKRAKVQRVQHFAAMDYRKVPPFMDELHQLEGVAARALQFTVLAVARTGETLGAKWSEIDWDRQLWVVPPQRMKSGREHSQPLSSAALDLLRQLPRDGDYIFPGRRGRPLPPKALLSTLRQMGYVGVTVHGLRSSFADWAGEMTATPPHIVEMCLAHAVGDATMKAYARSDLIERRRRLMESWAEHCCAGPVVEAGGTVVSIASAR